ncbi:MAG: hypothetical protein WBD07_03905 [Vicinamibacterales bacterium]
MTHHIVLSVLFFQEGDTWVAQGLERDIAAHGRSIEEARIAFERTLSGYIQLAVKHHQEPLVSMRRAPDVFWAAFERVTNKRLTERLGFSDPAAPPAYVIQAITQELIVNAL